MRRFVRAWLPGLTVAVTLAALAAGLGLAWVWQGLPPLDRVVDYQPRQPLTVLTADGVEIAQFGSERRLFVPISEMPRLMQDAVLAIEDTGFHDHPGISLRGLVRATLANLSGGMPQGASTITQQVARTFFLSTRRTVERKLKEALLALQIEQRLGKARILELYMNQIYLGQRAYGFGAAAQVYFGKPLAALSVAETAMLAGLPQNPIWANPVASPERARRRQRLVLARMRDLGVIDAATHDRALAEPLRLRPPGQVQVQAPHVAEMARQAVVERFGEHAYTQGIRVHTSLRMSEQNAAHQALRRALLAHERHQPWRGPEAHEDLPADEGLTERAAAQALKDHRDDDDLRLAIVTRVEPGAVQVQLAGGEALRLSGAGLRAALPGLAPRASPELALRRGSVVRVMADDASGARAWSIVQWPRAEGALVALDPLSGRVRALVGGFDFDRRQFNRATRAWRQPGSAFKPFLYSAALEAAVTPDTLVDDLPLLPEEGASADWNPKNSDGGFDGPITVRDAMARSKNMVSLRLLRHLGLAQARAWLTRFGFDPARHPDNLTLALGAGSVTPVQMAAAYAVFANDGHRVAPVVIEKIVDARGQLLFEAPPAAPLDEATRVLPARNAFLVRSLLAGVTAHGTAARAQAVLRRPDLYGKTGTTNDAVDAWFAGFQPSVVAVAWIGHDDPQSLGDHESGGGLALPAWIAYMQHALRGLPVAPLTPPDGVSLVDGDWRYDEWATAGAVAHIGVAVETGSAAAAPGTAPR